VNTNQEKKLLSNHAIVALGILTRKAKSIIGDIKVADVLNHHEQAYTLLAQSVIYGDEDLSNLALELNKSLQIAPNLINALLAYIEHIKNNDMGDGALAKHQQSLSAFAQHLYQAEFHQKVYRVAADTFLTNANKGDHNFDLNLIRSFYPFWENTHSVLLKNLNKPSGNLDEKEAIMILWESLDNAFLTTIEESLLAAYTQAIQSINIPKDQIVLRIKIAKLILIKQRAFKNTANGYRHNIDAIQNDLSTKSLLAYFLSVSREFYSIWQSFQLNQGELLD